MDVTLEGGGKEALVGVSVGLVQRLGPSVPLAVGSKVLAHVSLREGQELRKVRLFVRVRASDGCSRVIAPDPGSLLRTPPTKTGRKTWRGACLLQGASHLHLLAHVRAQRKRKAQRMGMQVERRASNRTQCNRCPERRSGRTAHEK